MPTNFWPDMSNNQMCGAKIFSKRHDENIFSDFLLIISNDETFINSKLFRAFIRIVFKHG